MCSSLEARPRGRGRTARRVHGGRVAAPTRSQRRRPRRPRAASLRTLYVQAPLTGPPPARGAPWSMRCASSSTRHGGLAGKVRVVVRAQDDGGRPRRHRASALRAQRGASSRRSLGAGRDRHVRVGLQRARAARAEAGRSAARLAGECGEQAAGSAPPRADVRRPRHRGRAARRVARGHARRVVSQRPAAGTPFASALASPRPAPASIRCRSRRIGDADPLLLDELLAGRIQIVAPGGLARNLGGRAAACDRGSPGGAAPLGRRAEAFGTLAFLDDAGAAADGVRVLSRFVPAEQLGGDARDFAGAYADLHGQPPPVALYAADAAARRPRGGGGHDGSRAAVASGAARPAAPRRPARHAGPRPRPAASRRGGWRCSWPTGRSAPNG